MLLCSAAVPGKQRERAPAGRPHCDLLAIPSHLRSRWWEVVEQHEVVGGPLPGYDAFVAREPTYPLVRVHLDPGEGLWLPSPPPAFDGWTVGKGDLDAMLVLREDPK